MTRDRWKQIEQIFTSALELTEADRPRFLDGACAGDLAMRREVEALIARARRDGESLQEALDVAAKAVDASNWIVRKTGSTVGNYRIENVLGSGGHGTVYLAYDYGRKKGCKLLFRSFFWSFSFCFI